MNPMMIYRLDRFGPCGHHRPLTMQVFAAFVLWKAMKNYVQQDQDIRNRKWAIE